MSSTVFCRCISYIHCILKTFMSQQNLKLIRCQFFQLQQFDSTISLCCTFSISYNHLFNLNILEQQEQYLEFLYFNKEDIRPFPINIQQFDHFQLFRNFSGWTPSTTPLRLQYIHHCDYTGLPAIIECSHSSVSRGSSVVPFLGLI